MWVADVVERENNSGGTSIEMAMSAIKNNLIEIDAMSGGIR